MFKKILFFSGFLISGITTTFSQSFLAPNVALKSHETLDIMKIILSEEKTEIYLKVENRISGGKFCADKNIWLVTPDGKRSLLESSNGIPVCPDTYKFRSPGEQLDFVLTFPPLENGVESVNLIEDCQQNCFSFYGVILDNNLNEKLNEAFALAGNNEPSRALVSFTKLAEENAERNKGAVGVLYLSIINLYKLSGNAVKAAEWYKKLESSGLPETPIYMKHLNSQGIKY